MPEVWYSILHSVVCPRAPLLPCSWAGMGRIPVGKAKLDQQPPPISIHFLHNLIPPWSCRSRVLPTTSNCVPGVYEQAAMLPPQHCLHFSLCTVVTMWQIYSAPKPSSATAKGHFLMKPCHSYQPQLPAQAVTQGSARERLPDYRHSKAQTLPCST